MRCIFFVLVLLITGTSQTIAQDDQAFKLGTFEDNGIYVGLVLDDSLVVNLGIANDAVSGNKVDMPADMYGIIEHYDRIRARLGEIVAAVFEGDTQPSYVKALIEVKTLPPIMPGIIYNAAANYSAHAAEMSTVRDSLTPKSAPVPNPIPGIWERTEGDERQNPYIFLKSSSTVIADGESIVIPPKRNDLDWECELTAVVGRPASRVAPGDASDYIFGYTLEHDVSDRGGRDDKRMGSDWFLQKNHDTFGPLGPFIVPKEFIADPHALKQTLILSGTVMQDSNTGYMTHDSFDMLSYISNILTLRVGDVFAMGSPSGVGMARENPIYMKDGDVAVCTIEGIGTLTNPVVASGSN